MKKKVLAVVVGAFCAGAAAPAFAITDEEANSSIQFSFVPPGARSLGMGGAFLGRADDATAAYTNPAGLTQLQQFEVSAEGRHTSYSSEFASGGNFDVDPLDLSGVDYSTSDESVNNLSYFSVVWPQDRWAIALYRHELVKYESNYVTDTIGIDGTTFEILPYGATTDIDVVNYGVSGAFELTDTFSVGASILYSKLDLESATARPTATTPFATAQLGDDNDVAFNVGALWRLSDQWQLGAVYRDGPEFDIDAGLFTLPDFDSFQGFPIGTSFNTPSVYGVGLSFQPTDQWTFALDVNRVMYSELTDDLVSGFRGNSSPNDPDIAPLGIDDGTEIRLGAEYTVLTMANPFSIRAGVWRDPEHTIGFEGEPDLDDDTAISNAVLFSTGDDEMHYTFGVGAVFGRFQIDAAADFSDNIDTISVSGVLRFD